MEGEFTGINYSFLGVTHCTALTLLDRDIQDWQMQDGREVPFLPYRSSSAAGMWSSPPMLSPHSPNIKTRRGRSDEGLRKLAVKPGFGIVKHGIEFRQFLYACMKHVGHDWRLLALPGASSE